MASSLLRSLFAENDKLIIVGGAHDALGARLVMESGYDAVWASGLELSCSQGVPDAGVLTMTEMARATHLMARSVRIPVVSDCDCGFGDIDGVIRTVKRFEAAGAAAVSIADTPFPKINSLVETGHKLAEIGEFCAKIRAAKAAQNSPDFMVVARIEALIAGFGEAEALRRAEAYSTAGADAILIHSKRPSPHEILSFIDMWDGGTPLIVVPTTYHAICRDELRRTGKVRMVIYANHGMRAAIASVRRAFRQIREEDTAHHAEEWLCPLQELLRINGVLEIANPLPGTVRTLLPA